MGLRSIVVAVLGLLAGGVAGEPGLPSWEPQRFPCPMQGVNPRRTGQSAFAGPVQPPASGAPSWTYVATAGAAINLQAVISHEGVFFGTWGILRRESEATSPERWDKSDGRYYGLRLERQPTPAAQELFAPVVPAPVPVGYRHAGRAQLPRDRQWVGAATDLLVSFYNGTIEGTACIDPLDGTHYVGRGDGALYAIDPLRGRVRWRFATFDPQEPTDPDGGGEIVGGPTMGHDRTIYVATVGMPWPDRPPHEPAYETQAVYAVSPEGRLRWRYPASDSSLDNWLYAPPAISPDGRRLYVATLGGDLTRPGQVMALDLEAPAGAPDSQRLAWKLELRNSARPLKPSIWARTLAVGMDGRIYGGGFAAQFGGAAPVAFAIDAPRDEPRLAWQPAFVELHGYPSRTAQLVGGLALDERGGATRTVHVSTTHIGTQNGDGGKLFALDPRSGTVVATFDPATLAPPAVGGLTAPSLDVDGRVYIGVRGKRAFLFQPAISGRMVGLEFGPAGYRVLWHRGVDGQLDWVPPAIGANGGLYFGSTAALPLTLHLRYYAPGDVPENTSPVFTALLPAPGAGGSGKPGAPR